MLDMTVLVVCNLPLTLLQFLLLSYVREKEKINELALCFSIRFDTIRTKKSMLSLFYSCVSRHLSTELYLFTAYPPKSSQRASQRSQHNTHAKRAVCLFIFRCWRLSCSFLCSGWCRLLQWPTCGAINQCNERFVYKYYIQTYSAIYIAMWRRDGGSSGKLLACMREFSLRLREQQQLWLKYALYRNRGLYSFILWL